MLPKLVNLKNLIQAIPFMKDDHEAMQGLYEWIKTLQGKSATDTLVEEDGGQIRMELESIRSAFQSHIVN
jgi:hypothetical protein